MTVPLHDELELRLQCYPSGAGALRHGEFWRKVFPKFEDAIDYAHLVGNGHAHLTITDARNVVIVTSTV
jgi:hypothetical protein